MPVLSTMHVLSAKKVPATPARGLPSFAPRSTYRRVLPQQPSPRQFPAAVREKRERPRREAGSPSARLFQLSLTRQENRPRGSPVPRCSRCPAPGHPLAACCLVRMGYFWEDERGGAAGPVGPPGRDAGPGLKPPKPRPPRASSRRLRTDFTFWSCSEVSTASIFS